MITKNLFYLIQSFFRSTQSFSFLFAKYMQVQKMKYRFEHEALCDNKVILTAFELFFLLLIKIIEISLFCFLFCEKFHLILLVQNYFPFFSSLVCYVPHSQPSCFCSEATRNRDKTFQVFY